MVYAVVGLRLFRFIWLWVVFVCCYVGVGCIVDAVGLQMHFVISACWILGGYDVVGVIVNSVVDVLGVFDMFVVMLACLDFALVFIQLVGVWCGEWLGVGCYDLRYGCDWCCWVCFGLCLQVGRLF